MSATAFQSTGQFCLKTEHGTKELQLGQDRLPVERALGVQRCIESDSLKFKFELKDLPCTRGILSTVSSVYDPLGPIAPVVLVGKQILQDICQGSDWDKPDSFGRVVTKQLHCMFDTSYLHLVDDNGQVHCSFVAGKARVTPRKMVSIPRLELAAATVLVRAADMLKAELYYSDVVLGFINNKSRRFHVYVAFRVQLIHDHT